MRLAARGNFFLAERLSGLGEGDSWGEERSDSELYESEKEVGRENGVPVTPARA